MNDIKLYEKPKPFYNNSLVKFQRGVGLTSDNAHWHEQIELLYYKSGGYHPTVGNKSFEITESSLIAINSNELHSNDGNGEGHCVLRYAPEFFHHTSIDDVTLKTLIPADDTIKEYFEKMEDEYLKRNEGYDMIIMGYACQLMAYLIRNYKDESASEENKLLNKKRLQKINDFITYITKNYDEKITTSSIAKHFNISERYFSTLFKSQIGITPTDYINKYRVQKAAFLLESTDMNITEIAAAVGFDDPNYFSRIFKKYMNDTPKKYQKKYNLSAL